MIYREDIEELLPKLYSIKVDFKSPEECWNWKNTTNQDHYGLFGYKINGKWQMAICTRLMYEWAFGDFDKRMCVLHTCDNPRCVNPNHLWLGTRGDNAKDRDKKGRRIAARGSNHPMAILNEPDVIKIKKLLAGGDISQSKIAKIYGVTPEAINRINKGKSWTHVIGEKNNNKPKNRVKLNNDKVILIKLRLKHQTDPQKRLAEIFGVKGSQISCINTGRTWRHVVI